MIIYMNESWCKNNEMEVGEPYICLNYGEKVYINKDNQITLKYKCIDSEEAERLANILNEIRKDIGTLDIIFHHSRITFFNDYFEGDEQFGVLYSGDELVIYMEVK